MGIRRYKPTTPGRRGSSVSDFAEITRSEPEKSLVRPLHGRGGRNVHGKITTRHQGGGHKRAYRVIDFRRNDKDGVPAKVAHIEYDPNRTSRIALLHYADGEKRYIIAPARLRQGDRVEAGPRADIKVGNNLPLRNISDRHRGARDRAPPGRRREDRPRGRAEALQLVAKDGPSRAACACRPGEDPQRRRALSRDRRRGGQRRAEQHQLGQGGPHAGGRGSAPPSAAIATNRVDHPHGGGEGKTSGGSLTRLNPAGKPRRAAPAAPDRPTVHRSDRRRRRKKRCVMLAHSKQLRMQGGKRCRAA